MERKITDDLQKELMGSNSLNEFLSANSDEFNSGGVQRLLTRLFEKRGITKSALAKQSGMSEIYVHQIFAGRRNPSRSRLICLCFGLGATLDETQELLRLAGLAPLYPRIRRDAIIIYGLVNSVGLHELNDKLFTEDEETLFSLQFPQNRI